ncbi:hypothetical protein HPB51_020057 [Rhipicephalus microplus]|uniref:Uncharacterized protein n=1 Tax=Rhipicephalus microplus TaxID=6941 RepID=A0A9J6E2X0_RHIMP|nr:hypothetical protein HPB51_020057 [Rhipicephalus microplus]
MDCFPEGNLDGMRSSSGAHGVELVETGVDMDAEQGFDAKLGVAFTRVNVCFETQRHGEAGSSQKEVLAAAAAVGKCNMAVDRSKISRSLFVHEESIRCWQNAAALSMLWGSAKPNFVLYGVQAKWAPPCITMAELEAAPLPEGNDRGPQGAVAATKMDAGSFDTPCEHDEFDDDDDFGHFATAAGALPTSAADANHIPAADNAATSVVTNNCDSTNGTSLPNMCTCDSDDDSGTSRDASGPARRGSADLPSSGESGGVKREDSFDDFQQAVAPPPFEAGARTGGGRKRLC